MEFLQQPILSILLIVLIGIAFYFSTKVIQEIKLNEMLKRKQKALRVHIPSRLNKKRFGFLGSAALAPILVVVLFIVIGYRPTTSDQSNIITLDSGNDIIQLYTQYQEQLNQNTDMINDWMFMDQEAALLDGGFTVVPTSVEYTGEGSDDYSETNNQVIGVDEMDNVLTDGKYIYTIQTNEVTISLAYTMADGPDVLSHHKSLEYTSDACSDEQFVPMGMYVDESRLIVIGNIYKYQCESNQNQEGYYNFYYYNRSSHIEVKVYDKTNDFSLEDTYTMKGYFTGTRKINDALYIVTNQTIPFYGEEDSTYSIDDYLPKYTVNDQVVEAAYEDIIYLEGTNPNTFTTFYGIDLDTTEVDMEVLLSDRGSNLYVSEENIYLVGTLYYFWDTTFSIIETENKVRDYQTSIMKIKIKNGSVDYQKTGFIAGHTLNQFSMDEYNGNLRITTTTGWWGEDINNRLFILDEEMEVISVLQQLGKPGETIRSTRFVGEYAYLVTFEQTDPFYVINVSDPTNPVVEGKLEVPGFSTYLQPLGEDKMLGIGFGDSNGGTSGIKLSIYDISNKEKPIVFDEVTYDYSQFGHSYTSVTYEHKDLLVSFEKGLIALPFSTSYYSNSTGYQYNSGILVFHYSEATGLSEAGYVQHEENAEENIYVYKSKFISDYLYTISNKYIKVSTIEHPETILNETIFNSE